jgi:hypothetical protein
MTNAAYTPFKEGILGADFDLTVAGIQCMLVRGYTFSAAHQFVSDVTGAGGTINGTSANLANPTIAGGVFDADDTSIATTASASNHVLILFQATAVTGGAPVAPTAQRLIFFYDVGTNLPIQPGTGTITVAWSNGSAKIFAVQ